MIIIGAGLSGLLCGALNPGSVIYEAGPQRESDHKAVFRCKSNQVGKILGIPFKEVEVHKSIWLHGQEVNPTPRTSHLYSQKVTGKITGRSITNVASGLRYIPPMDFAEQLQSRCIVKYNRLATSADIGYNKGPVISTIPMGAMRSLTDITKPGFKFESKPIWVNQYEIDDCDSYCTVYYPDPYFPAYRASLNGNILITEGMMPLNDPNDELQVLQSLGIDAAQTNVEFIGQWRQNMGKINPIDNRERERIISVLTLEYNVYSLGRFATWRPKLMLDDLLEDIWHIQKMIQGGKYAALKHKQKEKN